MEQALRMLAPTWEYSLPRLGVLLVPLLFGIFWFRIWGFSSCTTPAPAKAKLLPRPLKPHPPDDCLKCVGSITVLRSPTTTPVRLWPERKSARGRPKRIDTEGYAGEFENCE